MTSTIDRFSCSTQPCSNHGSIHGPVISFKGQVHIYHWLLTQYLTPNPNQLVAYAFSSSSAHCSHPLCWKTSNKDLCDHLFIFCAIKAEYFWLNLNAAFVTVRCFLLDWGVTGGGQTESLLNATRSAKFKGTPLCPWWSLPGTHFHPTSIQKLTLMYSINSVESYLHSFHALDCFKG